MRRATDKDVQEENSGERKPLCKEDFSKNFSKEHIANSAYTPYHLAFPGRKHLLIRGYTDYYGGYAEHARNVIFGLNKTGRFQIRLLNISCPIDINPLVYNDVSWFADNKIDVAKADYLCIATPGWLQEHMLPGVQNKIYAWTMTETRRFNKKSAEWLKNANVVLCPTDTDVRRAQEAGVASPVKMHLGYDSAVYNTGVTPLRISGLEDKFIFGYVGTWSPRKGIKDIVRAYVKAFKGRTDVALLLVAKYGVVPYGDDKNNRERWTIKHEFDELRKEFNGVDMPFISLIDAPMHPNVLASVCQRFDALVGFSAGESTWLPGLEVGALNKPVIQLAADCNGFMEYLNDGNSFLCRKVRYEKADEEMVNGVADLYDGQELARGDVDELASVMEYVFNNSETSSVRGISMELMRNVSNNWQWSSTIDKLSKLLLN